MSDPYSTHQRMLVKWLLRTTGPILELGCGGYSTPLIHEFGDYCSREIDTFDNHKEWLERFRYLQSERHVFVNVSHWDDFVPIKNYGLVFVDHAPGERRIIEIQKLLKHDCVFVIHDTEDSSYEYEKIYGQLSIIETDSSMTPWTTVAKGMA